MPDLTRYRANVAPTPSAGGALINPNAVSQFNEAVGNIGQKISDVASFYLDKQYRAEATSQLNDFQADTINKVYEYLQNTDPNMDPEEYRKQFTQLMLNQRNAVAGMTHPEAKEQASNWLTGYEPGAKNDVFWQSQKIWRNQERTRLDLNIQKLYPYAIKEAALVGPDKIESYIQSIQTPDPDSEQPQQPTPLSQIFKAIDEAGGKGIEDDGYSLISKEEAEMMKLNLLQEIRGEASQLKQQQTEEMAYATGIETAKAVFEKTGDRQEALKAGIAAGEKTIPYTDRQEYASELKTYIETVFTAEEDASQQEVKDYREYIIKSIDADRQTFLKEWPFLREQIKRSGALQKSDNPAQEIEALLKRGDDRVKAIANGEIDPREKIDPDEFARVEAMVRDGSATPNDIRTANLPPSIKSALENRLDKPASQYSRYSSLITAMEQARMFDSGKTKNEEIAGKIKIDFITRSLDDENMDYEKYFTDEVFSRVQENKSFWSRIVNFAKFWQDTDEFDVGVSLGYENEKKLDPETAKKILDEAGGDKNKARQIAKERGYSF